MRDWIAWDGMGGVGLGNGDIACGMERVGMGLMGWDKMRELLCIVLRVIQATVGVGEIGPRTCKSLGYRYLCTSY